MSDTVANTREKDAPPPKGAAGTRGINEDYDTKYGFHDDESAYDFKSKKGLDHEIVEMISRYKNEPDWMREIRHAALDVFRSKPMPTWGNTKLLHDIDFENIHYYVRASERQSKSWDDVPTW